MSLQRHKDAEETCQELLATGIWDLESQISDLKSEISNRKSLSAELFCVLSLSVLAASRIGRPATANSDLSVPFRDRKRRKLAREQRLSAASPVRRPEISGDHEISRIDRAAFMRRFVTLISLALAQRRQCARLR